VIARSLEKRDVPSPFPWGFILPFGVAQLVSWGSFYYAFTLFLAPMEHELGWHKTGLSAAYSLGIGVAGLCAPLVGRWIDRHGGRGVMTMGSAAGGLLLVAWSQVGSYPVFFAIWIGLGVVMSAVLYDPAFAVAVAVLGEQARRGITVITLIAGFASTVFVPLTHYLIAAFGWRHALIFLGLLSFLFCGGVHAVLMPRKTGSGSTGGTDVHGGDRIKFLVSPVFWSLTACFVANYFVSTALAVHLLPMLLERGYAIEIAVAAIASIGPAQVGARFLIAFTEGRLGIGAAGFIATLLLTTALAILALTPPGSWIIFPVTVLFGLGNGTMTIVRAVSVAEFLGRTGYGSIQGAMALPIMIGEAAAPFLAAAIWTLAGGYGPVAWALVGVSAFSALAFGVAAALVRARAKAALPFAGMKRFGS
jgi:MFS family permease